MNKNQFVPSYLLVLRCAPQNQFLFRWALAAMYLVVSSPPATEETGAVGREIESRLGIGW
jgi:hypothetical protein